MVKYFVIVGAVLIASLAGRTALAADAAQMEQNKKTVIAFEDAALNQKDFDEAKKYLGPRYTQHNPTAPDGPEGLKGYIAFLKEKFPQSRSEHKRVLAEGDYVMVHDHAVREPGSRGLAIFNLYKLENGKVVEHWDVIQPVPETAQNNNGMF
jgi:predicted SnoaL-like aldol condensation-catalyzing enzyme